jgi:hypothetical protein
MVAFIRRFTSLVAAFALIQAMAVPAMAICNREHPAWATVDAVPSESAHHVDTDCPDPPAPTQQEHGRDCLASCISMLGCSAPNFVAESTLGIATSPSSPVPSLVTLLHSGRSLAPDRPPPRA